jgi:HTH-type transcriptional regulator / antitoxin HigA
MAARTAARAAGTAKDRYFELVRKFPLKHFRTDRELNDAIEMMDSLLAKEELAPGEQDYLDVLTDLVELYEEQTIPMPAVSDAAMLRHLIEARRITQAKLAQETGVAMSTISNVLNGRRTLTRSHIGTLATFFSVTPGCFPRVITASFAGKCHRGPALDRSGNGPEPRRPAQKRRAVVGADRRRSSARPARLPVRRSS